MSRITAPTGQVVAELAIGGESFFAVDENPEAFNLSPETLGGTSVRISLIVDDRAPSARRRSPRALSRCSQ